jgi:large conductance mechanosensitive channel
VEHTSSFRETAKEIVMHSFIREFREFAAKGNVVDLAVGIIIGVAFGKIVDSMVNDLILPVVAGLLGKADFSGLFIPLAEPPAVPPTLEAFKKAGVPVIAYGNFLSIVLNFIILAFVIFVMVKLINRFKRQAAPAEPPAPPEEIALLREIRDAVKRP